MSELALSIGILWAMLFSCVAMAAALGIAWVNFGHPRYALSWALAFGLSALQTLVNGWAVMAGKPPFLMLIAFALVVAPSPFLAIGVRQRAGLPDRRWRYAVLGALTVAYVAYANRVPALVPFADPAATLFAALVLMDGAAILRPRGPRPEAAEWAMAFAIAALAGVELIVAILTCLYTATGDDPRIGIIYHGMLAVVVPPCVVAAGVSAILVVASDLALQLRRLAARDPLTGLYNRRGFHDLAVQAIALAQRSRQPVTIALCDIDHFKRINDDHGHAKGDETLVFVCRRLSAGLRAGDLVGRIGGEEFALLLLDGGGADAAQVMERIRADIAAGLDAQERHVSVTASFGVAEVGLDTAPDPALSDAFDRADRALYRSKTEGRNRVTLAGTAPPEPTLALARPMVGPI